jgi:hypothetical protein
MQTLIKTTTRAALVLTGLAALSACSAEQGYGNAFFKEAGAQIDSGEFGNATLHNQLVQTCRTNGVGSGKVGAHAGDPVVVLDPSSTPSRKVYRVHCSGKLDGKYALVTYREYVGSATQRNTVERADSE